MRAPSFFHLLKAALFSVALAAPLHAADAPPTADALLDAAKQATGGSAWDKIVTWHEVGKGSAGGLKGTYESWMELPTFHNTSSFVLGPMSGSSGWNGTKAWTTDSSREVRVETSDEAISQAIQDGYRSSYTFFFPGRYADQREYAGTRQADGKTFDAIKITPHGTDPFEVWFDRATHRIDREVQLIGSHPQTFLLKDYRPAGGILVPHTFIQRIGNDPKFDIVFNFDTIVFSGPEDPSRYAPPPPPANSAQWPAGQDSVTFPFHLRNNHIYLLASINGQKPTPFMFDTGATNVLELDTAKKMGIKVEGALPSSGFGDKIEASGLAKVKSVSIGGLSLPDQVFGTEDSPGWAAIEGTPSGGLLGYEFVKRAVLTIDYAKQTMTFTKPEKFRPPAGVTPIAFTFSEHIPMLPGTLEGAPGQFELDTGSRGALTVSTPYAKANDLVARTHATITGTTGYGVGGPVKSLLGRADQLTLGAITVRSPIVEFVLNESGGGNETHTAGNIGGDVLKRFTVTLDYGNRLVYLQPNASNDTPEVFDRSGLWIARAADGAIEIADVTTNSPAAKLGLVTGDEILAINDKAAKDIQLYDLRETFKGPVGTSFVLKVKSKSGTKTVTLVLADQV
jgi:hypothetical protein